MAAELKVNPVQDLIHNGDSVLKHVIDVIDERAASSGRPDERSFRSRAEQDYLEQTGSVLAQMQPLSSGLERLGSQILKTNDVNQQIKDLLAHLRRESAGFAQEARFLAREKAELQAKVVTADAYIDSFYVSDHERRVLEDPAVPLSDEFLAVLERVKTIQAERAVLLLAEAPSAGEYLMLETRKLLDSAYSKIRTAIEFQLRQNTSTNLRKYMALLTERPLLFKSVLLEQSGTRRQQLSRDFASFVASEHWHVGIMPTRYLGNVLAWLHAAIVNEYENISLLLDPGEERILGEASTQKTLEQLLSTTDTRMIITELVDSVISSIESSLRQQMNAVIVAQTSAVVVDELQAVLLFYRDMLAKYEQPTLITLFNQLDQSLDRQFEHCLKLNGDSLETAVDTARAILETYDQGVLREDAKTLSRLNLVIDSPLSSAMEAHKTNYIELLNILNLVVSRLAGFIVVQPKLDDLVRLEDEFEAKQVVEELVRLKQDSHLNELVVGALTPAAFFETFDAFLSTASTDIQDRLQQLNSQKMIEKITKNAITQFIVEYEAAVKHLSPSHSAEELRTLLL